MVIKSGMLKSLQKHKRCENMQVCAGGKTTWRICEIHVACRFLSTGLTNQRLELGWRNVTRSS
jgi:hypothetical protein